MLWKIRWRIVQSKCLKKCTEQMSKEITNINYDPPDNSQSSITKPRIGKIYEMDTINTLRIQ